MCPDWELNQRPFGSEAGNQSTGPHHPGLFFDFLKKVQVRRSKFEPKKNTAILFSMQLRKSFHDCSSHLGLFCWDILSESVYILPEQESLLLDGKNTLTQNHLRKEKNINSYQLTLPHAPAHVCATSDPSLPSVRAL